MYTTHRVLVFGVNKNSKKWVWDCHVGRALQFVNFLSLSKCMRWFNRDCCFPEWGSRQYNWLMPADMPAATGLRMALSSVEASPCWYTMQLRMQMLSKTWRQRMYLESLSDLQIFPQLETATVTNLIVQGSWAMQTWCTEVGYLIFVDSRFVAKLHIKENSNISFLFILTPLFLLSKI